MFLALLWSYEYNEHVQNLEPSTKIYKYLGSCMFGYAWNCLDLIQNDQILKSYKILNSRSYAAMLEKSACLHCRVFMWNPLETSLFRRLEAKTCKLQTCCVDSTIPYGRIMVQWQYHMSHIESYRVISEIKHCRDPARTDKNQTLGRAVPKRY